MMLGLLKERPSQHNNYNYTCRLKYEQIFAGIYKFQACRITDVRRRSEGKGLVVPCVYIFSGKTNHLEKLIAIFPSTSYVDR